MNSGILMISTRYRRYRYPLSLKSILRPGSLQARPFFVWTVARFVRSGKIKEIPAA